MFPCSFISCSVYWYLLVLLVLDGIRFVLIPFLFFFFLLFVFLGVLKFVIRHFPVLPFRHCSFYKAHQLEGKESFVILVLFQIQWTVSLEIIVSKSTFTTASQLLNELKFINYVGGLNVGLQTWQSNSILHYANSVLIRTVIQRK